MYQGLHCSKYLLGQNVYIPANTSQALIEGNLTSAFNVISHSDDLTPGCGKYAYRSICHSAYPLCRKGRTMPKLICQEVCFSILVTINNYIYIHFYCYVRTVNCWRTIYVIKSTQLLKNIICLAVLFICLIVHLYQRLIVLNLVLRNQKLKKVIFLIQCKIHNYIRNKCFVFQMKSVIGD